jgi:hypothetical protein
MIEDLIKGHVEAFNARDLEALMAGFADDAVWITGKTTAPRARRACRPVRRQS